MLPRSTSSRTLPAFPVLPELAGSVKRWHERALAEAYEGLPENLRNVPVARAFQKKPDPLLVAAARWQPAVLAPLLHTRLAISNAHQPALPQRTWHEQLQQTLRMVVQQTPIRCVQRASKIGERSVYADHPFTSRDHDARDLCIELLLAHGAPVRGVVLQDAALHHGTQVFNRLLQAPDLSFRMYNLHAGDELLHSLAAQGVTWALPLLVAAGMEVDHRLIDQAPNPSSQGSTALSSAAHNGQLGACEALLALGADPRIVNDEGFSPSELARRAGHVACAALLLTHEQTWWRHEMHHADDDPASLPRVRSRL